MNFISPPLRFIIVTSCFRNWFFQMVLARQIEWRVKISIQGNRFIAVARNYVGGGGSRAPKTRGSRGQRRWSALIHHPVGGGKVPTAPWLRLWADLKNIELTPSGISWIPPGEWGISPCCRGVMVDMIVFQFTCQSPISSEWIAHRSVVAATVLSGVNFSGFWIVNGSSVNGLHRTATLGSILTDYCLIRSSDCTCLLIGRMHFRTDLFKQKIVLRCPHNMNIRTANNELK